MRRSWIIGLGVAAVVAATAAFVIFGVLPSYSFTLAPKGQIVAAPGSKFQATVKNAGLAGGTFKQTLTVDDGQPVSVTVKVGSRGTTTADLPLPDTLTPGKHTLKFGAQSLEFTALTPARLKLGKLSIDKPVVKRGGKVTLTMLVYNLGEADGTFPGVLKLNGKAVETTPSPVKGTSSTMVTFEVREKQARAYKVDLSGAKGRIVWVKMERPANGAILKDAIAGGVGKVVIKNSYPQDCMVVMTAKASGKPAPLLKVYVRARQNVTISTIHDGVYYIYYARGGDWNHYNDDFLSGADHRRFPTPMTFRTSSWTTSWADYSAMMMYTQRHTQYSGWTIPLGKVTNGKGVYLPPVSTAKFPGI
jgi:hypothetical protein